MKYWIVRCIFCVQTHSFPHPFRHRKKAIMKIIWWSNKFSPQNMEKNVYCRPLREKKYIIKCWSLRPPQWTMHVWIALLWPQNRANTMEASRNANACRIHTFDVNCERRCVSEYFIERGAKKCSNEHAKNSNSAFLTGSILMCSPCAPFFFFHAGSD